MGPGKEVEATEERKDVTELVRGGAVGIDGVEGRKFPAAACVADGCEEDDRTVDPRITVRGWLYCCCCCWAVLEATYGAWFELLLLLLILLLL